LLEVNKILSDKINKRFIERHYYENASQRINLDFMSFEEFSKDKLIELERFGAIFDDVSKIEKIPGIHKVYDFNIQDNHNFVAEGMIIALASRINIEGRLGLFGESSLRMAIRLRMNELENSE